MVGRQILKITALAFALLLSRSDAFAGGPEKKPDHIDINPLITFAEQLQEVNTECANRPLDRSCEERKDELKASMRKLREICRRDNQDPRCDSLSPRHQSMESNLEQFCRGHSQDPTCLRRKDQKKRRTKYNALFCSKNPDAKRCQLGADKSKQEVDIDEYCKVFPEKKKCVRYAKEKAARKPPSEGGISGF